MRSSLKAKPFQSALAQHYAECPEILSPSKNDQKSSIRSRLARDAKEAQAIVLYFGPFTAFRGASQKGFAQCGGWQSHCLLSCTVL